MQYFIHWIKFQVYNFVLFQQHHVPGDGEDGVLLHLTRLSYAHHSPLKYDGRPPPNGRTSSISPRLDQL